MAKSDKKKLRKLKRQVKALDGLSALEKADLAAAVWALRAGRKAPGGRKLSGVAEIADQPPLVAMCLAVIALGGVRGDERLIRAGLQMLAAAGLAIGMKSAGKRWIARTRPAKLADQGTYMRKLNGPVGREWNAFPSGHTAGAVAVMRAASREYPSLDRLIAPVGIGIGALKMARGDHYPSDVAAGYLIGLGAERLTRALLAPAGRPSSA
jgi:membrane-associated phospholipid phosphatase